MMAEESVETLCFYYICDNKRDSKMTIINSLVLQLCSPPFQSLSSLFMICRKIVEENSSDH